MKINITLGICECNFGINTEKCSLLQPMAPDKFALVPISLNGTNFVGAGSNQSAKYYQSKILF